MREKKHTRMTHPSSTWFPPAPKIVAWATPAITSRAAKRTAASFIFCPFFFLFRGMERTIDYSLFGVGSERKERETGKGTDRKGMQREGRKNSGSACLLLFLSSPTNHHQKYSCMTIINHPKQMKNRNIIEKKIKKTNELMRERNGKKEEREMPFFFHPSIPLGRVRVYLYIAGKNRFLNATLAPTHTHTTSCPSSSIRLFIHLFSFVYEFPIEGFCTTDGWCMMASDG